jgi:hypothetical protein
LSIPGNKSEQVKLSIVIALAIVAAIVAYFRFIHKGDGCNTEDVKVSHEQAQFDIPKTEKSLLKKPQQPVLLSNLTRREYIRDIFAPVKAPEKPAYPRKKKALPKATGALQLKGTILGGKEPIAVINDKFVRTGDKVGEFQIVKILKNKVLLKLEDYQKVLEVFKSGE